ncbi:MAG: hydantoinase/oxoprolinase family protein [Thaumarchaeota archaeon]|nr:hydantoinase/oxoprolinase family protein [Nitrososphaerota archaeon]
MKRNRDGFRFRIGVDTGGTFVDAVEIDEKTRRFRIAKSPTTPSDPAVGFMNVIEKLGTPLDQTSVILHGTTLGVNAIIQEKGANTGIITNEGFNDIFEIGRGNVPDKNMYDFNYYKPPRLIKRRNVVGIPARISVTGGVLEGLDEDALKDAAKFLVEEQKVNSIAVSFLHSYKNPEHERRVAARLSKLYPDVSTSISSQIANEYREYERTSTTVIDAYIKPIVSRYLEKVQRILVEKGFRGIYLIMRSDGGTLSAASTAELPVSTIQSGPAGGVVGSIYLSKLCNRKKLISLDIGGTSLDVCVIEDSTANIVHQTYVSDYPLLLTMYDVRSIGAGGGSIASVKNGLLQVGPESAGADPGPMCYGRGGARPTVTDALVILGYIDPAIFLSGEMPLKPELSRKGIEEQVCRLLDVDLTDAAAGIARVTVTNSMGALRQITVEEGRDPAEFSLLAFGGAGPPFAAILAWELGIPEVIVPNVPAAFSALGMLMSNVTFEVSQTHITTFEQLSEEKLKELLAPLETKVESVLRDQSTSYKDIQIERSLELRYSGQEHSLELVVKEGSTIRDIRRNFDELHLKRYGHMMKYDVELVNLRAKGVGELEKPMLPILPKRERGGKAASASKTRAYCLTTNRMTDFLNYSRMDLLQGDTVQGPAIIDEGVTRTIIHTGQALRVDEFGNLVISSGTNQI